MGEKILFVDDDPNILNSFKRQLRKMYQISTASSGQDGLDLIKKKGPFAVVLADMKMPHMDGITFLKKVKELSPDSIRLMITGNADQKTAISALHEGNVFRFINKPCSVKTLIGAITSSVEQYRLINAEKQMLEGTLNGSIKLLMDILSLIAPWVTEGSVTMKRIGKEVAKAMKVTNIWEMEMAIMLSRIAYITLPTETLSKVYLDQMLSSTEQETVMHLPEIGQKLLTNIPRLQRVAKIILYQNKNFDGSGFPLDSVSGENIPLESRILRVLHDIATLKKAEGLNAKKLTKRLYENEHFYDPRVLEVVVWYFTYNEREMPMTPPQNANLSELKAGQILVSNAVNTKEILLLKSGLQLTDAHIAQLNNYNAVDIVKQPLRIVSPMK